MISNSKYFIFLLLFLVLSTNAAPIVLYNGNGNESPVMESSTRTFPEPPEYYANWGILDGMNPPYIRISGQTGEIRNWAGAFTFTSLPVKISGGSLQIQARATNKASLSIWLETETGNTNPKTYSLTANQTSNLNINISDFGISVPATIRKVYTRLNQVPAYQYTTVFFDNIILSNPENSSSSNNNSSSSSSYFDGPLYTLPAAGAKIFTDYLIAADTVAISDQAKTLGGDIYGNVLELGADTKIYGNVATGTKCFLRERVNITGALSFPASCTKQNGIVIGKEIKEKTGYSHTAIASISVGSLNKSVAIGADERLLPGAYGSLRIDARSTVRLQSGSYVFSSVHTEPDVKLYFDLTNGPVKIYVLDGIRFADRNTFSIAGGNPSEIEWNVICGSPDEMPSYDKDYVKLRQRNVPVMDLSPKGVGYENQWDCLQRKSPERSCSHKDWLFE